MIYLILAILCSSSIAMIFKISEGQNLNRLAVTSFNYLCASLVALFMLLVDFPELGVGGGSFESVVLKNETLFSLNSSVFWGISVGVFAGVFFFLSFLFYQKSVRESGMSLSGAFGKLGILIPMLFSLVIWREYPRILQWTGIAMALLSILLLNWPFGRSGNGVKVSLILLFVSGGLAEFTNKLFQNYTVPGYKNVFLLSVFSSAFLISFLVLSKSRTQFKKREVLTGFLVGLPNLFSSFFLIAALESIKGSVAFPVYSAGSVALMSFGGFVVFGEKLRRLEVFALAMVLLSLIMVNLS